MKIVEIQNTDVEMYAEQIKIDCSYAINAMKETKSFLYHGTDYQEFHTGINRTKVRSSTRDSSAVDSMMVTEYMKAQGCVALRDNSIYTTGSQWVATGYGMYSYGIVPLDGSNISWSPQIKDFYSFLLKNERALSKIDFIDSFVENYMQILPEKIKKIYNEVKLEGKNRTRLILIDMELQAMLVRGAKEPYIDQYFKRKHKLFLNNMSGVEFKVDDLADAILSRNEVLVHGEFYAVPLEEHKSLVIDLLLEP